MILPVTTAGGIPNPGSPTCGTTDTGTGECFVVGDGRVYCTVLSSVPDRYPLDANNTKNASRYC